MLKLSSSAALCVQLIFSTAVSAVLQGFAAVNRLSNRGVLTGDRPNMSISSNLSVSNWYHIKMDRLSILVGRLNKSVAPTKYFFKVQQIGRFMPLIGAIRRSVESSLK